MENALMITDVFTDTDWKIVQEKNFDKSKIALFENVLKQASDEEISYELNEAVKSLKKGKVLEVEGRVQYADKKNENDRIYPMNILKREVGRLQDSVINRRLLGELDHPEVLNTSLKNVSHLIVELRMVGPEMRSKWEILPIPNGDILRNLYEAKVQVGASSRGAGRAIMRDGVFEIADDYVMRTIDAVTDPSTAGSYPKPLSEAQIILPGQVKDTEFNFKQYHDKIIAGLC
jgi:hypothetical protein